MKNYCWGALLLSLSSLTEVTKHLQSLLTVKIENKYSMLRFFDSRVLYTLLEAAPASDQPQLFGPISHVLIQEGEENWALFPRPEQAFFATCCQNDGWFSFTEHYQNAFDGYWERSLSSTIHLDFRAQYPGIATKLNSTPGFLLEYITSLLYSSMRFGFRSERHIKEFVQCSLLYGKMFYNDFPSRITAGEASETMRAQIAAYKGE
jgi:hypothetical protein